MNQSKSLFSKLFQGAVLLSAAAGFLFFQSPVEALTTSDEDPVIALASLGNASDFAAKCGGEKKSNKSAKEANAKCGAADKESTAKVCSDCGKEGCSGCDHQDDSKAKCSGGKCGDGKCGTKEKTEKKSAAKEAKAKRGDSKCGSK